MRPSSSLPGRSRLFRPDRDERRTPEALRRGNGTRSWVVDHRFDPDGELA
jgi:hypothetical protein